MSDGLDNEEREGAVSIEEVEFLGVGRMDGWERVVSLLSMETRVSAALAAWTAVHRVGKSDVCVCGKVLVCGSDRSNC